LNIDNVADQVLPSTLFKVIYLIQEISLYLFDGEHITFNLAEKVNDRAELEEELLIHHEGIDFILEAIVTVPQYLFNELKNNREVLRLE
jgi:hypothetical protein